MFVDSLQLEIGNQAAYLDIVDNVIVGSATAIRFEFVQQGWIRCNVFHDVPVISSRDRVLTEGNLVAVPLLTPDHHLAPASPARDAGWFDTDIGLHAGPFGVWADR